ncbi:hypothetical protein F4808DRAFT_455841 [Astrocystis sublimbata]|nr:hypothetical protein F4808DRAFT_455841 [Astrocystis sublimbata]
MSIDKEHPDFLTAAATPVLISAELDGQKVSRPSNPVQIYISQITDPYVNLSIEHFLLQKSHPDSVVLLLYANRPCIVIGRNQNPWVEVNLGLTNQRSILGQLRAQAKLPATGGGSSDSTTSLAAAESDDDDVLLVRRRSGGGTVFHDAGNVNYSVICPSAAFDRDKHAEMVVRALQGLQKQSVRVNERHDIVLDVPSTSSHQNENHDTTPTTNKEGTQTFKISGSAYKLTRTRSLHHGTCLLSSPHLPFLSQLLRSPAAAYIKARGVESVRSPVRNVGVSGGDFQDAVVAEFRRMYDEDGAVQVQVLEDDTGAADIPEIRAGVAELRSRDWIYAQTPQFAFSSHPTAEDPRPRPDLPTDLPASFFPSHTGEGAGDVGLQMTVRHGQITEVVAPGGMETESDSNALVESLKGLHLHHVDDWRKHVGSKNESVGSWLNRLFGLGN